MCRSFFEFKAQLQNLSAPGWLLRGHGACFGRTQIIDVVGERGQDERHQGTGQSADDGINQAVEGEC